MQKETGLMEESELSPGDSGCLICSAREFMLLFLVAASFRQRARIRLVTSCSGWYF